MKNTSTRRRKKRFCMIGSLDGCSKFVWRSPASISPCIRTCYNIMLLLFLFKIFRAQNKCRSNKAEGNEKKTASTGKLHMSVGGFSACKRFLWLARIALASFRPFDATGLCKRRATAHTHCMCVVASTQAQAVPTVAVRYNDLLVFALISTFSTKFARSSCTTHSHFI